MKSQEINIDNLHLSLPVWETKFGMKCFVYHTQIK